MLRQSVGLISVERDRNPMFLVECGFMDNITDCV